MPEKIKDIKDICKLLDYAIEDEEKAQKMYDKIKSKLKTKDIPEIDKIKSQELEHQLSLKSLFYRYKCGKELTVEEIKKLPIEERIKLLLKAR